MLNIRNNPPLKALRKLKKTFVFYLYIVTEFLEVDKRTIYR